MRHVALYILGPVVVALLVPLAFGSAALQLYPALLLGAIPIVAFFTLVVAMPLFVWAGRRRMVTAPTFVLLAFAAGFTSFLLFSYLSSPDYSSAGDIIYARNCHLTIAGWMEASKQSAVVGLLCIPGGLIWWLGARMPLKDTAHGA